MTDDELREIEEAIRQYPERHHDRAWYIERLAGCVAEIQRQRGNGAAADEAIRIQREVRGLRGEGRRAG